MSRPDEPRWWQNAVFYEIYVRSFADSTGSGVGDLRGVHDRLDHLRVLGVDALWLTPFYPSPMADHGYDVSDPRGVDPEFGTLADIDAVIASAHRRDLRVVVDVVPNHFSDRHPWFQEALRDGPGSPARDRFIFRDGRGTDGSQAPNNWHSTFGGPAWTRVADGQWYLHLFTPGQPDLNWRDPAVGEDFEKTLRFWLDKGVDGFRIDVAHGLFKAADLPDNPEGLAPDLMSETASPTGMWNQPEVHDVYRRWRRICAEYPNDPVLVGEVWMGDAAVQADYVRPDELHLVFNFRLLFSAWDPAEMSKAIDRSTSRLQAVGSPSTWVLSNHDVVRHPTRYGGGRVGQRRARAALLLMLGLPGAAFVYQGEELGLDEVDVPPELRQDPVWQSSGGTFPGRDGCRVPLPWSGDRPSYGFSTTATTWLPQPEDWAPVTVAAESGQDESMLALYRTALRVRPRTVDPLSPIVWHRRDEHVLDVGVAGRPGLRCVVNFAEAACPLPAGEVLLASGPLTDEGHLPRDTAAWVAFGP